MQAPPVVYHVFQGMTTFNLPHVHFRDVPIPFFPFPIPILMAKLAHQQVPSTNLVPAYKKTAPLTSPLTFQCKMLQNADLLLALSALSVLLCHSKK